MKRALILIFCIICGLTVIGCPPAVQTARPANESRPEPAAEPPVADAHAYERRSAGAGRTFIDTLNRGKEIGVSADDLPAIIELSSASAPAPAAPSASAPASAAPPSAPAAPAAAARFRIQILASGQVDMVRREQQKAEAATNLPVIMVAEQSLFKLYVGEFNTRAEAESALPRVRRDYPDAWVVNK